MSAATKKSIRPRALFVIDPFEGLKFAKDSSLLFIKEFEKQGVCAEYCEVKDLFLKGESGFSHARALSLPDDYQTAKISDFTIGERQIVSLTAYDFIFMRKDPPFDDAYLYATYIFDFAEKAGVRVINPPAALRNHNEKLFALEFPDLIPETIFSSDLAALKEFSVDFEKIILKPVDGMGGKGVFLSHRDDANFAVIVETLTQNGRVPILGQRFLPEIKEGDKRILILNGVPFGYALARIPAEKSVRGNLAAGGGYEARPLTARDREIADKVATRLRADRIQLSGIDVIGDRLTEINITSPTCFAELKKLTPENPAEIFIKGLF